MSAKHTTAVSGDGEANEEIVGADAVRTLAQYRPFDYGSAGLHAAHDDLVTAACEANGGGFTALEACRVFIASEYKVELELSEVRDARKRLIATGAIQRVIGGLALTATGHSVLTAQREAWRAAETQALVDWEAALRKQFPVFTREDIDMLKTQLRPWLDRVLAIHAAEAGLLLYPDSPHCDHVVRSMANADLGFLPGCRAELETRRASAFRMFVRRPTDAQREFLSRLLNTAFYLTVLTIDPRAKTLAAAEMGKTVLYLDTNFLYSVLGVSSPTEAFAAKRFLELCKELGVTLRISPWTVDELRTSIASSRRDVDKFRVSQKAAAVMSEITGEKGFVPSYWRAARDSGEDPETFFGKFSHFMRFLEAHGIHEHPEGVPEVEADVEAILDYASPLEGMYGPGTKERIVIEHDAKMRLLIEHLRAQGKPASGYTDVRYWFITESTRLPTYARVPIHSMRRPDYPFCILASTWAQIMRAMVPRTDDLDGMLVGLLASPYVGYRLRAQGIGQFALERLLARITATADIPPTVAIAMVNDRAMASKIGEETDPDVVDRLVDEALSTKAAELEEQIARTAEEAAQAEQRRADAESAAAQAEADRARLEAERNAALVAADVQRAQSDQRTREQGSQVDQLLGKLDAARSDITAAQTAEATAQAAHAAAERTIKLVRNTTAISVAVVVGVAAAVLIANGTIHGVAAVISTVAGVSLIAYITLRLISKDLATEFVLAITVVSGVVAIAGVFVHDTPSHHATHKPTHGAQTSTTP